VWSDWEEFLLLRRDENKPDYDKFQKCYRTSFTYGLVEDCKNGLMENSWIKL
jgi:hypothetical protein